MNPSEPDATTGIRVRLDELVALGRQPRTSSPSVGRRVVTPLAGAHASRVHGSGMAFSEVRAYQPGDDMRSIDWRVTARTGRMHSKLFEAERERPVWLCVDIGASMQFATRGTFKSVMAARAAGRFAWDAYGAGERVGAVVSSPGVRVELPAGRSRRHLMRILGAIADGTATPFGPEQDGILARDLAWLRTRARTGSRVVVLSDFYQLDDETHRTLRALARRCELTLVWIYDPLEADAPPAGRYRVSDGHTTRSLLARRSESWRDAYQEPFRRREDELRRLARENAAVLIPMRTDNDIDDALGRRNRIRPGASR